MAKQYNILFLADRNHHTTAVSDHINAIAADSRHQWFIENPLLCKTLHKLDLSTFDAIGIHYSIKPHDRYYLYPQLYNKLKEYHGTKFLFLQDEYQNVNSVMNTMAELDIRLFFTLVKPELHRKAYPDPRLKDMKMVSVLTAYVPTNLLGIQLPAILERKTDIFYRTRPCDYRLGKLAQERRILAEGVLARAEKYNLNVDIRIQEADRIYGQSWIDKHLQSKTVLATESGASIWDFSGEVAKKVKQALKHNRHADFDTIHKQVLQPYEGNILYNAISPRIFEAIALKTALVMYPGEYNNVCLPGKHYISMEKDFSNFAEVVKKLRDTDYLQSLVDTTYTDIILSGKYHAKNLSFTVDKELAKIIKETSTENKASIDISKSIEKTKQKYLLMNSYYNAMTEIKFILKNGMMILFDPSVSFFAKLKNCANGLNRYLTYLLARYHKQRNHE